MPLPPDLLLAISREGAGQVVLVVGAGCSFEPPTSLPLANQCALEAHRRLVADGILVNGDCADPADLSCVADTVMSKTNSQRELVLRLPREDFRHAEPNQGYLIAAAMLRERAISYLMTLNFDLAMSTALSQVGATNDVTIVAGPEHHNDLGAVSLIYLHRNVDADLENWILCSSALEVEWQGQWEEIMARRVLASPVTVFAGLGAPAAVLVETVKRIGEALPDAVRAYQVDPAPRETSAFFSALDIINEDAYLQMGWVAFMEELSDRLLECYPEHHNDLGAVSLIYLHRNVDADLENWILCSSALEVEWQGQWEEIMARRVLASPVTVFAGLGAPAAVLVETVKRIGEALPDAVRAYQVDPAPRETSAFFSALDIINEDAYLQMGWVAFMEELSDRLLDEHCNELQEACRTQADREGWQAEDVTDLCHRLMQRGLVGLGRVRARWMLHNQAYLTRASVQPEWLADLILATEFIERTIGGQAFFGEDGVVDFRRDNKTLGSLIFAHGRGIHRWLALETKIMKSVRYHIRRTPKPRYVLISGVQGPRPLSISLPDNIVTGANNPTDIVTGPDGFELVSVDELRQRPELVETIIN